METLSRAPRGPYTQLTGAERGIIRCMLYQHRSVDEIATVLGKHRSTVFRELKRNTNAGNQYFEPHAQAFLGRRRLAARAPRRIIENDLQFEAYVEKMLRYGLSPDQIVGYMMRSNHGRALSYRTIYRWVHRDWQSRKVLLRYRGKPRAPYGSRKDAWDPNKRHISQRPALVEKRLRVGDWEADLVHGTQDDSRHCILTLNDRATGFCVFRKLSAIDALTVAANIITALKGLPVKTLTCDNGTEFGRHKLIEQHLKCLVYFTDTRSPEQRGSNENLNGLLRQFFPKGESMRHVMQVHVTDAAMRLNGRPRKRYGYEAPRRLFAQKTGLSPFLIR